MAPINHGVFALAIKRRCPGVPLWALLVGVFTMFVPGLNGPEIFFSNAPGLFVLAISLLVLLSCVVLIWLTNPGHAD